MSWKECEETMRHLSLDIETEKKRLKVAKWDADVARYSLKRLNMREYDSAMAIMSAENFDFPQFVAFLFRKVYGPRIRRVRKVG